MSINTLDNHPATHHHEVSKTNAKVSKWGIVSFIYFILNIVGFPSTPVAYSSPLDLGLEIFGVTVELAILWYIVYYIKKSGLRGLQIAKVSLYGVAIINAYFIISSFYLMGPAHEVEQFAKNVTKTIIKTDFVELKKVSTKDLAGQLVYADDLKNFTDAINAAGTISECSFTESSYTKATLGFYRIFQGFGFGLQGEYAVRCYGSTGYIDFTNSLRKVDGVWLINTLTYLSSDPEIQKDAEGKTEE